MVYNRIKKIHKDGKGAVKSVDAELNLEDKDFKKTMKITWMAEAQDIESQFTPTKCVHFDHIISKGKSLLSNLIDIRGAVTVEIIFKEFLTDDNDEEEFWIWMMMMMNSG